MLSLAELREVSREHVHEVWEQVKKGIPLEGEKKSLGDALALHREFHPVWDRLLHLEGAEFSVAGVNPMLHVALHAVLENQLAEKQPPEAGTTLNRLMSRGFTRHEASHLILEKLIEEMAPVLREHRPFDVESYRRKLLALGAKTLGSKVGRNEPCPCGSGRKFKRCCGRDGTGLTSRPAGGVKPGRMLLATHGYAGPDYLANCPEDDPVLFLENGSAVARALMEAGDAEGAALAHEQLVEFAEKAGNPALLENALQDYLFFCQDEEGWEQKGIEVAERLCHLDIPPLQAAQYRLDAGDFYLRMGQKNEAETLYRAVVSEFPEFEWGLLRWARYKAESGHLSEAEEYYRRVIQLGSKGDPDAVESAKEELKALKL